MPAGTSGSELVDWERNSNLQQPKITLALLCKPVEANIMQHGGYG
ncbi:hypothetical protein SAMN06265219_12016 [Gracilimonas mengyeensis]|uniref:Uncharacterized protein n=1 Tax=Gracilimonas mengyeensis TaxID=1302730 RepID=A0A521FJ11_9BACT|nr:hypothetical protein SAMN06265219_12016 [Gracilimonas mengyeensis]